MDIAQVAVERIKPPLLLSSRQEQHQVQKSKWSLNIYSLCIACRVGFPSSSKESRIYNKSMSNFWTCTTHIGWWGLPKFDISLPGNLESVLLRLASRTTSGAIINSKIIIEHLPASGLPLRATMRRDSGPVWVAKGRGGMCEGRLAWRARGRTIHNESIKKN